MNVPMFAIVVAVLLVLQIFAICLKIHVLPSVKAGSVEDFHRKSVLSFRSISHLTVDGVCVDVSDLDQMVVAGNSMKDYHIKDGQLIFVEKKKSDEAGQLQGSPIVVFRLHDKVNKKDSDYKLRRFIRYVDAQTSDWASVYDSLEDKKVSKEIFVTECEERQKLMLGRDLNAPYILSLTYKERQKVYHYSLHAPSSVYGILKYAL